MIVQLKRVAHHPSNNYLNRVEATGTETDLDVFRRFAVFLANDRTQYLTRCGLVNSKVRYIIEKTEG